jgi:hypothetical protein
MLRNVDNVVVCIVCILVCFLCAVCVIRRFVPVDIDVQFVLPFLVLLLVNPSPLSDQLLLVLRQSTIMVPTR